MWLSVGIFTVLLGFITCKHVELHCALHLCHHDQGCQITKSGNQFTTQCVHVHAHSTMMFGCPKSLTDGQTCTCMDEHCIDDVLQQNAKAGGHVALRCGHHDCHEDTVCVHNVNKEGRLHSDCKHIHDPHVTVVCGNQMPTDHHPCYCGTEQCNKDFYTAFYHQTHGAHTNTGNYQCGDHVCHSQEEVCVIETDKEHHHIHVKCAPREHIPHHAAPACLPNLLSKSEGCHCTTRHCVDQAIIGILNGFHITGLACEEKDLHICHVGQVCEIRHHMNGMFDRHCADGRHSHECSHAPQVGEVCHCKTQACVYGQFPAKTTAAPVVTTSAGTTGPAMTTAGATISTAAPVMNTAVPVVSTAAPLVSTVAPVMSTAAPVMSTAAPAMSTEQPVVSTTLSPLATVGMSSTAPCTDDEDANFNCASYQQMYNLCSAATATLQSVANKRCRKFCGICGGHSTISPVTAVSGAQPMCVDHDSRCVQFKDQICAATASQQYVVATCPLTCNKCNEYFASLTSLTTVGTTSAPKPIKCFACGDTNNLIPCYSREVYDNDTKNAIMCPADKGYCMTDIYQDSHGNTDIFKRCVSQQTCTSKWINESAGLDYCTKYGTVQNAGPFECHFCCTGDYCNAGISPDSSKLVPKPTGK